MPANMQKERCKKLSFLWESCQRDRGLDKNLATKASNMHAILLTIHHDVFLSTTICFHIRRPMHELPRTGNYSVTGFEMLLTRRMSHYMITYYLPSSLFVVVSWTSFLIPSEDIQGRMALLVTLFLVLVSLQ